jgi:hypothetical protein
MFWKISLVLGLLLITTSFSFLNDAEARGSGEPCSYLNLHSFIKISNDPWKCEKVSYWVPEVCGKTEGLYLTDSRCQAPPPQPQPQPQSQPVTPAAAMPNPTSNSGTSYYQGVNDLHTSSQQVNCGAGTVLRNNVCVVGINDVSLTPDYTIYISNVILLCICGAVGFIIYKLGLYFHNRWDRTHNSRIDRDIIELTTDGRTQRSVTIANQNTVTAEVAKRIQEYENDFNTMGQSDPEYFLIKWNAEFIDSSKRGNELYGNSTIIPGRTLKLVKYPDTSTGQLYLVHVPDGINDPDDGVGWTLGLSGDDYRRMGGEA